MSSLLVFTENYARGGGNKYLIDLVNSVQNRYSDIRVLSNKNGIYPEEKLRFIGNCNFQSLPFMTGPVLLNSFGMHTQKSLFSKILKALFLLLDPLFFLINVSIFSIVLFKLKPSRVLSANGGYPASKGCLALVIAAKFCRIPVVLSVVSMPAPRRWLISFYEYLLDKLVWYSVTTVIVNANAISDRLTLFRDMPPSKAVVVYNGLEECTYFPELAVKSDKYFVIGCIARMDAAKGVFYLLDAFSMLVDKYPQMRLELVGSGDALDTLVRQVEAMGLGDKVIFSGHFSGDVKTLLANFDVYAFPSLWEGFPYSILEAMRSGCAIVSTDVGGIKEAITNNTEGILVAPKSSIALANAIEFLFQNEVIRKQLSDNARKKFNEEFTLNKMAISAQNLL